MSTIWCCCVIWGTVFFGSQLPTTDVYAQCKSQVPKDFSYPEAQETIQIDTEIKSNSLAGMVTDPTGAELSKVLVEHLDMGWTNRLDATFTDCNGLFKITKQSEGTQFLRFSKLGFKTLLIKVTVTRKAKSKMKIALVLSQ